ncbi:MAG: shikimate kinase [Desulfobulbaceae bacterium]|nr:MAG: shikimate kinase [Desulfobulbaceae bacterium]
MYAEGNKTIVLIGARASGKSSVGRLLAERTDFAFVDTDELISERVNASISTIVSDHGWHHFRALEKQALAEVLTRSNHVIATGGGAVLHETLFAGHRDHTLVVWLNAETQELIDRIQSDSNSCQSRPSLTGTDVVTEFEAVYEARKPLYERLSHFIINTTHLDREQIVADILSVIDLDQGLAAPK